MTAPVSGLIEAGASETKVTMSFYMPEKYQDAQPQPIDPEVFLEKRKELSVFVRTYGGFSNEQKSSEELRKLLESLQRDEQRYKDAPYYVAGYDSPFKLTNQERGLGPQEGGPGGVGGAPRGVGGAPEQGGGLLTFHC